MDQSFELRALGPRDLPVILGWRNHVDVRRYMLTRHLISEQEHRAWFDRCTNDGLRRMYILQFGGRPLGFAQLSGVEPGGVADWGFYAAPDAPPGTGTTLGQRVLKQAFVVERLHKVCGKALDFNQASRRLHARLGFREEGVLREQVRIEDGYGTLICFGLLARDLLESEL